MFQSLRLGRVMGIDLFVHPTFWILPLMYVVSGVMNGGGTTRIGLDLAVLFAAFGCIALHELGHAAAARLYGIRTRDIVLYPIGGVARLEGMPEKPLPEIVVALAGPLVNVFIAMGILGLLVADGVVQANGLTARTLFDAFWMRLFEINVVLVLFNLIPAFPMDGGRVFRAVMNWFTDRVTATQIASIVGGVFAALIALAGILSGQFMLVILAGAVFLMGRAELAQVREREEEKRWGRRGYEEHYDDIPYARRAAPADGWQWDPNNGGWIYWQAGYPVRRG